jgi:hypothetical protein
VRNVGDTGVSSLVLLDRFEVDYPQASVLRGGTFEGAWSEEGTARIALPVGTGAVSAVDVTDPARPLWLVGLDRDPSGSVGLRVGKGRRYLLAAAEDSRPPDRGAPLVLAEAARTRQTVLIAQAFWERPRPFSTVGRRRAADQTVSWRDRDVYGHGGLGRAIRDF